MRLERETIKQLMCEMSCAGNTALNTLDPFEVQREAMKIAKKEGKKLEFADILLGQEELVSRYGNNAITLEQLREQTTGFETSRKPVQKSDDLMGGTTPFSVRLNEIRTSAPLPPRDRFKSNDPLMASLRNLESLRARTEVDEERSHVHQRKIGMLEAPAKTPPSVAVGLLRSELEAVGGKLESSLKGGEAALEEVGPKGVREVSRFNLQNLEPPLILDGKQVDRAEISKGSFTHNLQVKLTFAGGETQVGYLQASSFDTKANLRQFDKLIQIGSYFGGNRFEHDKAGAANDPKPIDWDVEMTTPETVGVYRDHVYPAIVDSVRGMVKNGLIPKDAVVYDVGCGRGDLAAVLHEREPRIQIFGGEFNGPSLERARSRWSRSDPNPPTIFPMNAVEQVKAKAEENGIKPDVILMSGFIAKKILDTKDPKLERERGEKIMRQVHDVLPPGGMVVMAQKTDNLFSADEFRAMGFQVANTWSPEHQRTLYVLVKPKDG